MHRLTYRPITSLSKFTSLLIYRRAMATTNELPPAPWRQLFLEHVQTMPSPEFTLGTVRKIPTGNSSSPDVYHSPRARTCIFRGLFAELPVNPKNDAELNPEKYESDCLTFTTDCRMDKMVELMGVTDEKDEKLKLSRRGEFVEAVFWTKETGTQWRFRGRCYVLGPDVDGSSDGDAKEVTDELLARMRNRKESQASSGKEWSFGREVTAHFGNLSPLMRGSFRNPPPGSPVSLPVGDDRLRLGQKVTDLNDEVARANFRLVVIVPAEVDRTDLSDPMRGRRWKYAIRGASGSGSDELNAPGGVVKDGWEKVEVWP